jgi:NADP-dependent 3-hydroxy acid dehydrogenase YdfG
MSYGARAAERIAGKTVLITGASSGIGRATAYELVEASNGHLRLILAARRVERLNDLKEELEKKFEKVAVLPVQLDVSNHGQIPQWVKDIPQEWSNIDILINNAYVSYCSTEQKKNLPSILTSAEWYLEMKKSEKSLVKISTPCSVQTF